MRGHPVIRGHFLRMTMHISHDKEPVMKGHLSCSDTILDIKVSPEDRFHCKMI